MPKGMKLVKQEMELEECLHRPPMCRVRGKEMGEQELKWDGAVAKMTDKWEDIMTKMEEASAKRNEIKEKKKTKRFNMFMDIKKN